MLAKPTIPKPDYGSPILNEIWERLTHKPFSIMGPITAAYPRNIGWHPYNMKKNAGTPPSPLKFSDLTIRILTKHITNQSVRSAFPNCANAWRQKYPHVCSFKTIFASFGTRLSDATEERQWRKYVHRATNVRKRNPDPGGAWILWIPWILALRQYFGYWILWILQYHTY